MYSLKYNESISTKTHEHYTFINKNCCTIISARCGLPIELVIYHDRKEFSIYHMYGADEPIMDDIFYCIYDNLEFLGAEDYNVQAFTNGNVAYIEFLQRKIIGDYYENN